MKRENVGGSDGSDGGSPSGDRDEPGRDDDQGRTAKKNENEPKRNDGGRRINRMLADAHMACPRACKGMGDRLMVMLMGRHLAR